jgi:CNT family concentrative nucleoside transporter
MDFVVMALRGLIGLAVLIGLATLLSSDRKRIPWRVVGMGVLLQIVFALLVLKTAPGNALFAWIGSGFQKLLNFTLDGTALLFGPLGVPGGEQSMGVIFAFQILPTIIFFGSLMAVLYHLGLVQPVVRVIGLGMAKVMRLSGAESLAMAANIFVGQTEAPLVVKPYVETMTRSELFALMVGGMATIAGGVMAAYISFLGGGDPVQEAQFAKHLLSASIMNAPAALLLAKVMIPETQTPLTRGGAQVTEERLSKNTIEAAASGASEGLMLALNVGAMLLAFVALIAMINAILGWVGAPSIGGEVLYNFNGWIVQATDGQFDGLTLQSIFGFVLAPIAWVVGIDNQDLLLFGSLLGQKIAVNEFVAYLGLVSVQDQMTERSVIISTYALCGFGNFSSIAIQIGGLGGIAPSRRAEIAELGIRAVIAGTLATCMSATIAGVLI